MLLVNTSAPACNTQCDQACTYSCEGFPRDMLVVRAMALYIQTWLSHVVPHDHGFGLHVFHTVDYQVHVPHDHYQEFGSHIFTVVTVVMYQLPQYQVPGTLCYYLLLLPVGIAQYIVRFWWTRNFFTGIQRFILPLRCNGAMVWWNPLAISYLWPFLGTVAYTRSYCSKSTTGSTWLQGCALANVDARFDLTVRNIRSTFRFDRWEGSKRVSI